MSRSSVDATAKPSKSVTYLEPSDEEAIGRHFRESSGSVLKKGKDTPAYIEKGYNIIHRDECKEKHKGNLADNCPHGVHGLQLDKLISFETKILFQSGHIRIVLI